MGSLLYFFMRSYIFDFALTNIHQKRSVLLLLLTLLLTPSLRLLTHSARVLVRLLTILLLNGSVVEVLLAFLLDVETLEEAVEVEMLQIVRAEGEFGNDEVDVLVLQL